MAIHNCIVFNTENKYLNKFSWINVNSLHTAPPGKQLDKNTKHILNIYQKMLFLLKVCFFSNSKQCTQSSIFIYYNIRKCYFEMKKGGVKYELAVFLPQNLLPSSKYLQRFFYRV